MPDQAPISPAEALGQAQRLLDEGRPFEAHEVLEGQWKVAAADERELWQGLTQLVVGLTHLLRGNHVGALKVLARGRDRIARYAQARPHGIDISGLISWVDELDAHQPPPTPRLQG